jgi:hypothetical protein
MTGGMRSWRRWYSGPRAAGQAAVGGKSRRLDGRTQTGTLHFGAWSRQQPSYESEAPCPSATACRAGGTCAFRLHPAAEDSDTQQGWQCCGQAGRLACVPHRLDAPAVKTAGGKESSHLQNKQATVASNGQFTGRWKSRQAGSRSAVESASAAWGNRLRDGSA